MKSKKQKLKEKAWKLFSEWVRRRDANEDGYVSCVTCGKVAHWQGEGMQAGHFISGRSLSILFDVRNCHTQCYACNVGRGGSYVEYFIYMENRYGREVIDELRILKNQPRNYGIGYYEYLIDNLQRQINGIADK